MRLYIIRHADPDYANDSITPAGQREAAALAERFAAEGLDFVYCSPLGRACATAAVTGERLGQAPQVLEWTRELSHWRVQERSLGETCVWDVHGETVRALTGPCTTENWFKHKPFDNPAFFVGFEALKRHSDEFLARHGYARAGNVYRIEQPNRHKVAVFCHGGFGLTWLAYLLDIPLPLMWTGFFLPPSSVTTVLLDERSRECAVPRCIGLGDVSHLVRAGLGVQPSGIRANFH